MRGQIWASEGWLGLYAEKWPEGAVLQAETPKAEFCWDMVSEALDESSRFLRGNRGRQPGLAIGSHIVKLREGVGHSSNGEPLKVFKHQKNVSKLSFRKINLAAASLK